jgi:membrane protein YqaA with SNARE-associated domain
VSGAVRSLFLSLLHLGSAGLFILGICDSSFLFAPLGNDVLLTALTVNNHERLWLYVLLAACGSTAGVFLLDLVARKGGVKGIQKATSPKRFEYLRKKMEQKAGTAVFLVCLAPPPFPFTLVVGAASAFNYPRSKLLGLVFLGRMIRFIIVGLIAIYFGQQLIRFSKSSVFIGVIVGLAVIALVGSALSIYKWVRQSRKTETANA